MARTKSKPIERQPSSEYTTGQPRTPFKANEDSMAAQQSNGAAAPDGLYNKAVSVLEKKEAGLPQLVIAVAGIYASLCVLPRVNIK